MKVKKQRRITRGALENQLSIFENMIFKQKLSRLDHDLAQQFSTMQKIRSAIDEKDYKEADKLLNHLAEAVKAEFTKLQDSYLKKYK